MSETGVIIDTKFGSVRGMQKNGITIFRGIPYAEAPIGKRRFLPPAPPKVWTGVRDALYFGPIAPQKGFAANTTLRQSEDCLTLNISTPAVDGNHRPVVVWIHGGAHTAGFGADFDGSQFAVEDDIVFVSINYRLGVFGFLQLEEWLGHDYKHSGNCGVLDVVAALHWVRDNISFFGGNPNKVTVMGGSAGAKLANTLLVTPAAKGLYHQTIAESGALQSIRDRETAASVTLRLLKILGLDHHEAHKLLDLPVEAMMDAQAALVRGFHSMNYFGPVIDGATIPCPPMEFLKVGNTGRLPLLLGTNRDEAASMIANDPILAQPKRDSLQSLFGKNSDFVWRAYCSLAAAHTSDAAWQEVLTRYIYLIANTRLAEILAEHDYPVWVYRFDWSAAIGAYHSLGIALLFNHKGLPPEASSPEARFAAHQMHAAFVAFIRNGDPNIKTLPEWPQYTAINRKVMIFDSICQVRSIPPLQVEPGFSDQVIIL